MAIDITTAQAFLDTLGTAPFVFQTFTDNKEIRKKQSFDPLAKVLVGSLDDHARKLVSLSSKGAGVFVQVNAGESRGGDAISHIRSLFLDLDNPATLTDSMAALRQYMPQPTCMVQSSKSKCHVYWRVNDCPVDKFSTLQVQLAKRFGGDLTISNLDRVMRLPGFPHQKYDQEDTTFAKMGGTYETLALAHAAAKAPDMILPTIPGSPAVAKASTDVFGLDIAPAYEAPTSLPEGNRTQPLVQHAGHLISQGYSEEYTRNEIIKMNEDLCPEGQEPLTITQLEGEVLGSIGRFAENRLAESPHETVAPPPPTSTNPAIPPPTDGPIEPDTNAGVPSLDEWLDRFLFIEEGGCVADRTRAGAHAVYKHEDFKRKYSNVFIGPEARLYNKWFNHPKRQDVRCDVYIPNNQEIIASEGVKMWNRYRPSDCVPVKHCRPSAVEPFMRHIKMLFPDKPARKLMLDWIAMTVTQPMLRIPWTPLIVSAPGAGKGFIFKVMSKMMGDHNCNMIIPERLENQFNGFIANSTLVCIDEMKFSTKFGISDKLKNLISETTMEVNIKNAREKTITVYANIVIFTNHENAAHIENQDRRFWIYKIPNVPDTEHFEEVWAWLEDDDNISHLLKWMQDRDLAHFKYAAHPPMTEAKQEMIEAGKSHLELIIEDGIEFREGPFAADVIGYGTVESFVMDAMNLTTCERHSAQLRMIWSRKSKALGRTTLKLGNSHKQVRVRCVRNYKDWAKAGAEDVSYEATRAAQMMLTPTNVDAPNLKEVK